MAATNYPLTAADWSDCGAADDCVAQLRGGAPALITVAAAKPAADSEGLELSRDPGADRSASIQKAGLKLWGRAISVATTIVVER